MFRVRWSKLFQLLPCFGFRFRTCVKWFEDNGESYRGTLLHLACGAEDLMLDGNAARHKISILLGVAVSEASRYPLKGPGFIWELTFLLTKSAPIVSEVPQLHILPLPDMTGECGRASTIVTGFHISLVGVSPRLKVDTVIKKTTFHSAKATQTASKRQGSTS